jgi:TRAP-type uncharacterized transport system substrate-binding protein
MTMKKQIIIAAYVALFAPFAYATKPVTSGDEPAAKNNGVLKFATGSKGKGYNSMFTDLNDPEICRNAVPMQEIVTSGGLENLMTASNKKADVFMAQLDTIKDMSAGDETIQSMKAVAVLNYNYLHVLTAAAGYTFDQGREWYGAKKPPQIIRVTKFSDLKGRTVALVGSAKLMAQTLQKNYLKDYNMKFVEAKDDDEAARKVLSGEAQAMMTVSGAPYKWVSKLTTAGNLTMIPFDEDASGVYSVRKIKYPNINVYNMKVLASPNILMARDFAGVKAQQVNALYSCLKAKLQDLKDGEYEAGWNEVNPAAVVDLPRFGK